MTDKERQARIRNLEQRIADLRARLPKHSVPMAMMVELEELEDELERARGEERGVADPEETAGTSGGT